jgi:hypothetical protein
VADGHLFAFLLYRIHSLSRLISTCTDDTLSSVPAVVVGQLSILRRCIYRTEPVPYVLYCLLDYSSTKASVFNFLTSCLVSC